MIFQQIDLSKQRLLDSTGNDCGNIQAYCGYLLTGLSRFFALEHIQSNYAVAFTAANDFRSTIVTPYGTARGRLVIQLVADVITGRYVFEKSVVSEEGQEIWTPIWAIRISRFGNVLLGDEGNIEIEVANVGPHSNSISAPAKSLLYCIASTPAFKQ